MLPDQQNTQGLEAAVLAVAAALANNKAASITAPYNANGSTTVRDLKIEFGWVRQTGAAGSLTSKTQNFETQFAAPPLVLLSHAGYTPSVGAPFPGSASGGYIDNLFVNPTDITNTSFVVNWARGGGSTFITSHSLFASYIAIGI